MGTVFKHSLFNRCYYSHNRETTPSGNYSILLKRNYYILLLRNYYSNILLFPRYYDPGSHEDYLNTGIDLRTVLAVPIWNVAGDVVGVLQAINKESNDTFSTEDIELLNDIGKL